jgi:hypothetical protein
VSRNRCYNNYSNQKDHYENPNSFWKKNFIFTLKKKLNKRKKLFLPHVLDFLSMKLMCLVSLTNRSFIWSILPSIESIITRFYNKQYFSFILSEKKIWSNPTILSIDFSTDRSGYIFLITNDMWKRFNASVLFFSILKRLKVKYVTIIHKFAIKLPSKMRSCCIISCSDVKLKSSLWLGSWLMSSFPKLINWSLWLLEF